MIASYIFFQFFPIQSQSILIALGIVVIFYMVVSGQSAIIMDDLKSQKRVAEARDPTKIQRVIIDAYTGKEFIISGEQDATFRDACKIEWPFDSIEMGKSWIIQDERGNDISERPLTEYHGIAKIISMEPMDYRQPLEESEKDSFDEEQESDMDVGVEFYD
jgi:hypothetical protein